MHFVKNDFERDGLNVVGRRAKTDIVEGAASVRLVFEGKLVIGNRARDTAGKRVEIGVTDGVENLRARRRKQHNKSLPNTLDFCN
jgi:hypothetical protein